VNVLEIVLTGHIVGVVGLWPRTLNVTLDAEAMFAGHDKELDNEKMKGKFPVSGLGQCVNLVIPSKATVVVADEGVVHERFNVGIGGADVAVIVI
jgi:hypothetical protein